MKVCGWNHYSQLDRNSNNKSVDGESIINPPCDFHVEVSTILSLSTHFRHTIWITQEGKSYAIGDNSDCRISGYLPRVTFSEPVEVIFTDRSNSPFKFVSVVCCEFYTLYLVSCVSTNNDTNKLILCQKDQNPVFLNVGNLIPLSLFGGDFISGFIEIEGGIFIINEYVLNHSQNIQMNPLFLPNNDSAIKLVCCDRYVIALGESGNIYESKVTNDSISKFLLVNDLSDKKVIDIAGTANFCFAIVDDGVVFGRGFNSYGKLGLPRETRSVSDFTKIEILNKYKIVAAFTGTNHSIFKTLDNKMIVCGYNKFGQIFIQPKESVFPPEEVNICDKFNFCVAGGNSSIAFFGINKPLNIK